MKRLVATALLLLSALPALANWPDKPIRIIVGSSPGGYLDVITRAVAKELSAEWGQPIVIQNVPGASGAIAAQTVAKASPDGYTWLASTEAHIVTNRFLMKNLGYDFHRDFVGVSVLTKADQVLVATKTFPARTLPELVELARKSPQKLAYGSWGIGSHPHLFFARLGSLTGTEFLMIPYKGVAPTMQALSADEVQLSVMSVGTARPLLDQGKLNVLASASATRTPAFPDVPTTEELGFKGLRSSIQMVLLLPRATPADVVAKASNAVRGVMRRPDFATQWVTSRGFQVVASDSKGVADMVDEMIPAVAEAVKAARVVPE
jgi:tripartite-type tricarboxylate transporter receptor subunit TctC